MLLGASYQNANHAYRQAFRDLRAGGQYVGVRERQTVELINYTTEIYQPQDRVIVVPGRRWNPFLAMSEILWFFTGRNDIEPLIPFNKRIAEFSDDGKTLNGSAYGYRLKDQVVPALARIRKDENDRRAVMTIWDKTDLSAQTLDPPCNDMIMLKLRDRRLIMSVFNRSNDIHWGLYAVNFPVFSAFQEYLAFQLGADVGNYFHVSNSLHYYTDQVQAAGITKRMTELDGKPIPELPLHAPMFHGCAPGVYDIYRIAWQANIALEMDYSKELSIPFFSFARDFLTLYLQGWPDVAPELAVKYSNLFPDWMLAADIYDGLPV